MISYRLSYCSYNGEEFQKARPLYKNADKESGCKSEMKYEKTWKLNNRNKQRKITWFNVPYRQNVKMSIGKVFLNLVNKYFPKHHKLQKTFNTNTLKVGYYSCMKKISSIIK